MTMTPRRNGDGASTNQFRASFEREYSDTRFSHIALSLECVRSTQACQIRRSTRLGHGKCSNIPARRLTCVRCPLFSAR